MCWRWGCCRDAAYCRFHEWMENWQSSPTGSVQLLKQTFPFKSYEYSISHRVSSSADEPFPRRWLAIPARPPAAAVPLVPKPLSATPSGIWALICLRLYTLKNTVELRRISRKGIIYTFIFIYAPYTDALLRAAFVYGEKGTLYMSTLYYIILFIQRSFGPKGRAVFCIFIYFTCQMIIQSFVS